MGEVKENSKITLDFRIVIGMLCVTVEQQTKVKVYDNQPINRKSSGHSDGVSSLQGGSGQHEQTGICSEVP